MGVEISRDFDSLVKIAVLAGGISNEREVSIQSGNCVAKALKDAGLNVIVSDIGPDNLDILEDESIDIFFPALHGEFGEDGQLQQILEDKSLVYIGSGPTASKLAFDKMASKQIFDNNGICTPRAVEFNSKSTLKQLEEELQNLGDKLVIKPLRQGSSIGISVVDNREEALVIAQKTYSEFGDCMVEEYIPGREVTVAVICGKALPIIEIRPKTALYDYDAKYTDDDTEFLFDTIEDDDLAGKISNAALDCFNVLGCRDFARIDFRLKPTHDFYVLEVNSIPGLTSHSLVPKAADRAGLSLSDLCIELINAALKNRKAKTPG